MNIVTVGIDLAKNVFVLHGVDQYVKAVFIKPKVARSQPLEMIAHLPPCLIGMEACSGAHYWAREFSRFGHTVKLMAPKFVAPYRMSGKRGKNDAADAAAICEAVTRPNMRFVPVKDIDQQAILCLHRTRQGFIEERTALYNRLRGLISEFGIVLPQKVERLRLMQLPGIGPTTASALVASLGGGHDFKNGRQLAAWAGLVPGQYSSGSKARLGRITKAGDAYLRSLLVMGARSVLAGLGGKQDRFSRWARNRVERRGYWKAAVAIAAKNLRLAWAVLHYGDDFRRIDEAA